LDVSSQAGSIEEALDMIRDAIKGHLEVEEGLEREAYRKKRVA